MPAIAIAGAAAVLVALVALLFVLAAPAFVRLFQATVGKLPVVGGAIASILTATFNVATSSLRLWADSASYPASTFLFRLTERPWKMFDAVVGMGGSIVAATGRIAARLSASVQYLIHFAEHLYNLAFAHATTVANQATARAAAALSSAVVGVEADIQTTIHLAEHLYNLAEADILSLEGALEGDLAAAAVTAAREATAALTQAKAYAGGLVSGLSSSVAAVEAHLGAQIGAVAESIPGVAAAEGALAAAAAVGGLDQAAHDLVQGPWEQLLPVLAPIIAVLDPGQVANLPGLGDLTGAAPATIPAILGLLVPALAATATEVAQCAVPMCENLGGLSSVLGDLASAGFTGLLLAAVADAVLDPEAAATEVDRVLGPVVTGIAQGFTDLVGAL